MRRVFDDAPPRENRGTVFLSGQLTDHPGSKTIHVHPDAVCEGNPVTGIQRQGNERRNDNRRMVVLFFVCANLTGRSFDVRTRTQSAI